MYGNDFVFSDGTVYFTRHFYKSQHKSDNIHHSLNTTNVQHCHLSSFKGNGKTSLKRFTIQYIAIET